MNFSANFLVACAVARDLDGISIKVKEHEIAINVPKTLAKKPFFLQSSF